MQEGGDKRPDEKPGVEPINDTVQLESTQDAINSELPNPETQESQGSVDGLPEARQPHEVEDDTHVGSEEFRELDEAETSSDVGIEPECDKSSDAEDAVAFLTDRFEEWCATVSQSLDRLVLKQQQSRDSVREKDDIIRRLASEVQSARKPLDDGILQPVFFDLTRLEHDLASDIEACQRIRDEKTIEDAYSFTLKRLQEAHEGVLVTLERLGLVQASNSESEELLGQPVNLETMVVKRKVPTEDKGLANTVQMVLRPEYKFLDEGRKNFRAHVAIYQYKETEQD